MLYKNKIKLQYQRKEEISENNIAEYKEPVITTDGQDFQMGFSFFFLDIVVNIFDFMGKIYRFFTSIF